VSSRQEQKAAARAAREQAEREADKAGNRRSIMLILGGLVAAALVVVLVVVLASGGDDKTSTVEAGKAAPGGPETAELLGGIPQAGFALGDPSAPVTMIEFNDMQCPVCKEYDEAVFGELVDKYVRAGKLRMEMRLQSFIGPDSVEGGKAVAAATEQNMGWEYAHLFYVNQGTENTGYVDEDFLRSLGLAIRDFDVEKMLKDMEADAAQKALDTGQSEFEAAGFTGTPSFLIGPTGGKLEPLNFTALELEQFTKVIDDLLAGQQ
jgi:protein-disulfide isomerase